MVIKAARPRPAEKPVARSEEVTLELSLVHTLSLSIFLQILRVPWLRPVNPTSSHLSLFSSLLFKTDLMIPTKDSNSLCSQGWP